MVLKEPVIALEEFKKLPSLDDMLVRIPIYVLALSANDKFEIRQTMPRIICMDGTSLSVQASSNHYCTPRNNTGPYTAVEVGFPSRTPPESWKEYAEDWENPTNCVYSNVPMELVHFFIGMCGGINRKQTFKNFEYRLS